MGKYGINVQAAGKYGVNVQEMGKYGLNVHAAGKYGVNVQEEGKYGVNVHKVLKVWCKCPGTGKVWCKCPGSRKVWCKCTGNLLEKPALLLFDQFRLGVTETTKRMGVELNVQLAVIPGGHTCQLQTLHFLGNKSYKPYIYEAWTKWMEAPHHILT